VKNAVSRPGYVTSGSVLDDLGFSPRETSALKFKAELYQAILKSARKYSQKQLQIILAEPQPRVSELMNGKIANKSVDKLLAYAGRLGIETTAQFTQTRKQLFDVSVSLPVPEVLRAIGEDAERNETSKLSTRQVRNVIKLSRLARKSGGRSRRAS